MIPRKLKPSIGRKGEMYIKNSKQLLFMQCSTKTYLPDILNNFLEINSAIKRKPYEGKKLPHLKVHTQHAKRERNE